MTAIRSGTTFSATSSDSQQRTVIFPVNRREHHTGFVAALADAGSERNEGPQIALRTPTLKTNAHGHARLHVRCLSLPNVFTATCSWAIRRSRVRIGSQRTVPKVAPRAALAASLTRCLFSSKSLSASAHIASRIGSERLHRDIGAQRAAQPDERVRQVHDGLGVPSHVDASPVHHIEHLPSRCHGIASGREGLPSTKCVDDASNDVGEIASALSVEELADVADGGDGKTSHIPQDSNEVEPTDVEVAVERSMARLQVAGREKSLAQIKLDAGERCPRPFRKLGDR